MDPMNEPVVMDDLRRHRFFGGLSLVRIGVVGVVTHDAEFGVISLFSVRLELQMAHIAVVYFYRFPARDRLLIGDRKVSDDVEAGVPLAFFDHRSIGPFDIEQPVTLYPDRTGSGGLGAHHVDKLFYLDARALRL